MPPELELRIEDARSASSDRLKSLIHDSDEDVLLALLDNPAFEETHAESLLERLDLSAKLLSAIAERPKWLAAEGVRLRLAKHPHAPKRFALSALRQLFLFDLVRLTFTPSAPADIRIAAEEAILARVPHLPIGEKLTLARRGPARVAGAILAEGHQQALKLALGNTLLTESQVLKVLAKPHIPERVVAAIAQHAKWSCRYNVRLALIRNSATAPEFVRAALVDIGLRDLKDLSELTDLALERRGAIVEELHRRSSCKEQTA